MTNYLLDMTDAADKSAVAIENFRRINVFLNQLFGGIEAGTSYRFKDGNFQVWDTAAATADPTKPWRIFTADGLSNPVAN